jgi:3-deoxy-7-phosphoheptulonate synthase
MMIVMRSDATQDQVEDVVHRVESNSGWRAHLSQGVDRTVIGVVGAVSQGGQPMQPELFLGLPGVDRVVPISRPYKLASREFRPADSTFPLDGFQIGGEEVVIIAGPCAVESRSTPCAAGSTNRALRPTPSRAWAKPVSSCWPRRAHSPGCPSWPR